MSRSTAGAKRERSSTSKPSKAGGLSIEFFQETIELEEPVNGFRALKSGRKFIRIAGETFLITPAELPPDLEALSKPAFQLDGA